jgi:hypothetical protein
MALNANQLRSKEFFFSGDLNFTQNNTYNLTSTKIESLSKEQLGDLIEAECTGRLTFHSTLLASIMQRYISLKFPNLKDKIIEISNGVIQEDMYAPVAEG